MKRILVAAALLLAPTLCSAEGLTVKGFTLGGRFQRDFVNPVNKWAGMGCVISTDDPNMGLVHVCPFPGTYMGTPVNFLVGIDEADIIRGVLISLPHGEDLPARISATLNKQFGKPVVAKDCSRWMTKETFIFLCTIGADRSPTVIYRYAGAFNPNDV